MAATAQARSFGAGRALLKSGHLLTVPGATCPAGVPTQTITVVNQARVRPFALAKVENAVTAQSLELRAAWDTPCAHFGPNGWPLYLKVGDPLGDPHGEHFYYGAPYGLVWTSGSPWPAWSVVFSHEVAEMLVDPTTGRGYMLDGVEHQLEVADPVEDRAYRLDGVYVTDFVLPTWYAGATTGAGVSCVGAVCTDASPLIASADAPGPYDEMGVLSASWRIPRIRAWGIMRRPMPQIPDDLIATMVDPQGRTVWLTQGAWDHAKSGHPEIRLPDLKRAVETAEKRTRGRFVDTEKLWARRLGPAKWFVVVVRYEGRVGRVKTALAHTKDPRAGELI